MQARGLYEFPRVRQLFEATSSASKLYDERDWARLEFASQLAVGSSVADIGAGPGLLVCYLAELGTFEQVTAFDIVVHSRALRHQDVSYRTADLRSSDFDAASSDTVFCMEVIEHIEEKYNIGIMSTLRRMAASRLVVTVPFNEPEPLWWHDKPGGHRQRFTLEKIGRLFPNAIATIQPRWGVDWLFIVEDAQLTIPHFQLVTKACFTAMLERR